MTSKIIILDFGSQYTQVIARRTRQLNVFSEIVRHDTPASVLKSLRPAGIILSGGPASVYQKGAPQLDKRPVRRRHPDPGCLLRHAAFRQVARRRGGPQAHGASTAAASCM